MASQALSNKPTPVFGLVDCNSFYASCERVFRPDLAKVPIVVATCNRNGLDLQSSHFSTGINCVYPSQQTEIICE
ncbi:hypothetical protein B1F75_16250 [Pseudomonas syringae]|nr:hypothetical protein B1F71_06950 [Pseudomonas syringae]RXT92356.1 hypothetical protein B1F75_16250 [Pseudomonas syringae]